MLVIACDPGLVNLGWCVLSTESEMLVDCGIANVNGADTNEVVRNVARLCQALSSKHTLELCLVERQPPRSRGLVSVVAVAIMAAFAALGIEARMLKALAHGTRKYSQRKSRGIALFRERVKSARSVEALGAATSHVADAYNLAHEHLGFGKKRVKLQI